MISRFYKIRRQKLHLLSIFVLIVSMLYPTGVIAASEMDEETTNLSSIVQIASGGHHSIALKDNGTVWTWGNNGSGQLGDGSTTNRSTAVQVEGLRDVIAITGGMSFSVALKSDGTVWAWGYNEYGQLGNGLTTDSRIPVQVSGLDHVIAISSGANHTLAVKDDGTVWAWGVNLLCQLGISNFTLYRITPIQVPGLNGIVDVAGGGSHSIALKNDGTVWTWGSSYFGQLGDGTTNTLGASTPVQVLTDAIKIDGGMTHTIALKSDGTVWTWGDNAYGQLGDGTTNKKLTPIQVDGLVDVTAVSAGGGTLGVDVYPSHTMALQSDGTVWAWGYNGYGQLGNGLTTNSSTPVKLIGLSGVSSVVSGYYHSIALKSDGTVWTWGDNEVGELGDATTDNRSTPVQVLASPMPKAVLTSDQGIYSRSDELMISVRLRNFFEHHKTNSATFKLEYDPASFELASGDLDKDIMAGSIPASVISEPTPGTLAYLIADPGNDYPIVNDAIVFSVRFKVKDDAQIGTKTFTLKGMNADQSIYMLDSKFKVYQLPSTTLNVDIVNGAKIDAYVSLYLGEEGSPLHDLLIDKVNLTAADKAFENISINVKSSPSDAGVTYVGRSYWVQENGHIAVIDHNNRLTGRLSIMMSMPIMNATIEIGGFGYLVQRISGEDLVAGQTNHLNTTVDSPIVLIPGDVGVIDSRGDLTIGSNGILDNVDFSAWLKVFKNIQGGTATEYNQALMNFTRSGVVNNEDFTLWLAAYKTQ